VMKPTEEVLWWHHTQESNRGVKEALLGGVDSIEHGSDFDDDIIKLF